MVYRIYRFHRCCLLGHGIGSSCHARLFFLSEKNTTHNHISAKYLLRFAPVRKWASYASLQPYQSFHEHFIQHSIILPEQWPEMADQSTAIFAS